MHWKEFGSCYTAAFVHRVTPKTFYPGNSCNGLVSNNDGTIVAKNFTHFCIAGQDIICFGDGLLYISRQAIVRISDNL